MKAITRKIDKLGRIVLPIDYRRALGIDTESELILELDGTTIKLNSSECKCRLCDTVLKSKPPVNWWLAQPLEGANTGFTSKEVQKVWQSHHNHRQPLTCGCLFLPTFSGYP